MPMQRRRAFGSPPASPLYFVEADFGRHGRAFVETDRDRNSRRQVIADIAQGQLENVVNTPATPYNDLHGIPGTFVGDSEDFTCP